ncbi:MAG: PQQ-binding-like beta-propeller repeat protein, partial [Bacteroidota bacterium]
MKAKSLVFILIFCFYGNFVRAQDIPPTKWVADLDGKKVEWLKLTPNKTVLLAGTDQLRLYGIDANTGDVLWESKATRPVLNKMFMPAAVKDELKSDIEGFFDRRVLFDKQNDDAGLRDVVGVYNAERTQLTILNVKTGKVYNDYPNAMEGQKAVMPAFFFDESRLMTGANGFGTTLLSLPSGDPIWKNENPISEEPIIDDQLNIYAVGGATNVTSQGSMGRGATAPTTTRTITGLPRLVKINGETGATMWEVEGEKNLLYDNVHITYAQDKILYVVKDAMGVAKNIEMISAADGKKLWSVDVSKEKAQVEYEDLSRDDKVYYVVLQRERRIDFMAIDLESGTQKWVKEFKLKKEDAPYLMATSYGAAIVSKKRVRMFALESGEEKWEYNYAGDGVAGLTETQKGELLLFTDKDIESIDPSTGDTRWDAKGGAMRVMDQENGRMIVDFKEKGS